MSAFFLTNPPVEAVADFGLRTLPPNYPIRQSQELASYPCWYPVVFSVPSSHSGIYPLLTQDEAAGRDGARPAWGAERVGLGEFADGNYRLGLNNGQQRTG